MVGDLDSLQVDATLPDSSTMRRLKDATECVFIQRYKDPTVVVVVLALENAGGALRIPISKWFSDSPNPFCYRLQRRLQVEVSLAPYEWEELRSYWTQTATQFTGGTERIPSEEVSK